VAKTSVVIGVIQDIHNFGVRVITYSLRDAGFSVVDVGTMATQEDCIKAAIETDAGAILVSSSNGHAPIDCQGMRDKCREAGLERILLYVGGNLAVTQQGRDWSEIEAEFLGAGFDRAYPVDTTPGRIIEDLRHDLGVDDDPPPR
jgi:methylaspartate mutase sigma subunit